MNPIIQLIVGLGNPGPDYSATRHNAGAWLVEQLAQEYGQSLNLEKKFNGLTSRITIGAKQCHLLFPTTYMNLSGQAVQAIASYYKIPAEAILVAHDELDIPVGVSKLKSAGGHGGHNGLRDIIAHLGTKQFQRLRIGIGRPPSGKPVVDYVLQKASQSQQIAMANSISDVIKLIPDIIGGNFQNAMKQLHTKET